VTSVAVTPDGKRLLSGSWDNTVRVWDLAGGQSRVLGRARRLGLFGCGHSGRRTVVSGSDDNTVRVWDLASGHTIATFHCDAGRKQLRRSATTGPCDRGRLRGQVHFLKLER